MNASKSMITATVQALAMIIVNITIVPPYMDKSDVFQLCVRNYGRTWPTARVNTHRPTKNDIIDATRKHRGAPSTAINRGVFSPGQRLESMRLA